MMQCSCKCNKDEKKGRKKGLSGVRDEDGGKFVGFGFLRNFLLDIQCLGVLDKYKFVFQFSILCMGYEESVLIIFLS